MSSIQESVQSLGLDKATIIWGPYCTCHSAKRK